MNILKIEEYFWKLERRFQPLIRGVLILFFLMILIHLIIYGFRLPEFRREEQRRIERAVWLGFSSEQIAAAIYRAEGGHRAKVPFGILSVRVSGFASARRACIETINFSRDNFYRQTEHNDFIVFLGRKYCPENIHPLNRHWVGNVKQILMAEVIK